MTLSMFLTILGLSVWAANLSTVIAHNQGIIGYNSTVLVFLNTYDTLARSH